uniref:peptidylprolyl isomerase n=1 Tax=Vannella robusta TaxID=1487602 RepID=A0A7S4HYB0_9EUKA|mmetsp:Transcript_17507/g.22269  ORF Transcript_17507/g.22269 Transcript_17507/m.22269 type:complete len:324 (+) Transcript_17507:2-973(+)
MLWSGTVTESTPLTMEAQFDLRITGASLGEKAKKGERVFLVVTHEDFVAEEPRTAQVCVLTAGSIENQYLDLVLDEGEPVSFAVKGSGTVHLTGYFVIDEDGSDQADQIMDSIGMFEDESDDESFEGPSIEAIDDSDEDMSSDEEANESSITQSILDQVRAKQSSVENKKRKVPEATTPSPAKKKQKTEQSPKQETPKKSPKKQESPKGTPQQTRVQKLRGGTVAEILTPGQGSATASKGQKVTVKYEGRLAKNGKKFDAGKFSFKLGKGEVIKGMDVGIEGMLMNEKRKITIPAAQGYGNQKVGDIPAKSDLVFEVTMLRMK